MKYSQVYLKYSYQPENVKKKFRDIDTLNIILLLCLYIDTPFSMKYSRVYLKYSYQPENVKKQNFVT